MEIELCAAESVEPLDGFVVDGEVIKGADEEEKYTFPVSDAPHFHCESELYCKEKEQQKSILSHHNLHPTHPQPRSFAMAAAPLAVTVETFVLLISILRYALMMQIGSE